MKTEQLEKVLDRDQIIQPEENSRYALEGAGLLPVAYPRSIEQLSELMKMADLERWAVIPAGGGTKLHIGNLPRRADLVISAAELSSISEFSAADLTATVQAGCIMDSFQESIGRHGQYLPIDPPYSRLATVGGVIASASSGPLRLSCGSPRDWLIGIKVVNADGRITRAGGKVVKNVAGYDLMKLYTGSFGTLAVIAEMSFKLRPRPASETTLIGAFESIEQLMGAARRLMESRLAPASLEAFSSRAIRVCFPMAAIEDRFHALAARFCGLPEILEGQKVRLSELWRGLAVDIIEEQESSRAGWRTAGDFADHYKHDLSIRLSALPSRQRDALELAHKEFSPLAGEIEILSSVGSGIARIFVIMDSEKSDDLVVSKWSAAVANLRTFCARENGSAVIERAPLALKRRIDVWGDIRSGSVLMRAVKMKLDPNGILNPGRFVMGI